MGCSSSHSASSETASQYSDAKKADKISEDTEILKLVIPSTINLDEKQSNPKDEKTLVVDNLTANSSRVAIKRDSETINMKDTFVSKGTDSDEISLPTDDIANTVITMSPTRIENSIPTKELLRGAYCSLRADGVVDLERMKVLCRKKFMSSEQKDLITLTDDDVEKAFELADPGSTGFLTFRRFLRICVLLDAELDQRESSSRIYYELAGHAPGLTLRMLLDWPDLQYLCQSGELSEKLIDEAFHKSAIQIGQTMYLKNAQFSTFLDTLSSPTLN